MISPFIIPLGAFVLVILIVGIFSLVKVHDREVEVHQRLHQEELEHQRKMKELGIEIERIRQGSM